VGITGACAGRYDTAPLSRRCCRSVGMTACQSCRSRPPTNIISNMRSNVKQKIPSAHKKAVRARNAERPRDQNRRGLFSGAPGAGSHRRAAPVPAAVDSRRPPAFPRPQRGQGKRERGQGRTPRQAAQRRSPSAADREQDPAGRDSAKKGGDSRRSAPPGGGGAAAPEGASRERPQAAPGGKRGNRAEAAQRTRDERTGEGGPGGDRQGRQPEARRAAKTGTATSEEGAKTANRPTGGTWAGEAPPGGERRPRRRAPGSGQSPEAESEGRSERRHGPPGNRRRHGAAEAAPRRARAFKTRRIPLNGSDRSELPAAQRVPPLAGDRASRPERVSATCWQLPPPAIACGSRQLRPQALGFDARAGLSMTEQTSVRPRSRRRQIMAGGRQGGWPRGLAVRCSFVNIYKKCLCS